MKFSTTAIIAAAASLVSAAPAPSPTVSAVPSAVESSFGVPTEAIIGQFSFDSDEYPLSVTYGDRRYVILLNSTIMEQAYASLPGDKQKREAEAAWGWLRFMPGEPFVKRDAEADAEAEWGWLRFMPGEPFVKRDAEADAEAEWGWLRFMPGEPFVKRDAEADAEAEWGWLRFMPGEPFVKREVEADLEG
ncbi:uncharacterized protein CXQ87_004312 [Candidozyma duobushaemuli]|uniref:Mating factor alpha precursor N-terminal domain-containing protein n=2 Tax=Candidozyma TaxID=3303203 RepID=A0ABX8I8F2_9ASCO|nr:uncharacterized protein CXQ87_004312 [[Candida] duobushaemulonis]PVH16760.1 hypothetical protein CXQ87_004312 [[Candida] duobushaemulonis]QWU89569.1 hypothetical protein CA3LBN_003917 [[Candida] haemuloni]